LSYPKYQLDCGWNALLPKREAAPALQQDINVDVAIIGAGWTGISAAKRWRELSPTDEIALLDASEFDEGNAGRNSGFLLPIALAEDARPDQVERMALCNQLTGATMQHIVEEVRLSGHDVDLQRAGTYRAAASDAGMQSLNKYRAFLAAAQLSYEELDGQALKERLGTDFYQQGLYSPDCYLAQPAAVIRALAARLPQDVQLFENTPALSLKSTAAGWLVTTPAATVTCRKLILANNAFSKDLGIGRSRLVAMYTFAGITPRLSDAQLGTLGSESNWGLLPTHRLGSTLRRTSDGRLLIRSMHGYEKEKSGQQINAELTDRLQRRFPTIAPIRFEQLWGGAVGFTYNGGAFWGEAKPNLYVSAGCNGGGTVKGTLLGKLLVEKAHGMEVPDVAALFGSASWMPPEPFRAIGFHVASTIESWQGRKEL